MVGTLRFAHPTIMPNVFTKNGPAVRCLPFPAVDLSFKQKHPANNAASAGFAEIPDAPPKSNGTA
jgi:hypothetical protein